MRNQIFAGLVAVLATADAGAVATTFMGFDAGSESLATSPNAVAAASSFDAATPTAKIDKFLSPYNPDYTRTLGEFVNTTTCASPCPYNTSDEGVYFLLTRLGTSVTFSFTSRFVDAFGFYLTGFQQVAGNELDVRVTYDDRSYGYFDLPLVGSDRGTLFYGLTDVGRRIAEVSIETSNYIFGLDDFRYRFAPEVDPVDPPPAVPAPPALALLGGGLLVLIRRRLTS